MTTDKWKTQIYDPYVDAWKVIKILQEAYNHPELFEKYMNEVQRFADTYTGNDFAELLRSKLLLRADDVIAKMDEVSA